MNNQWKKTACILCSLNCGIEVKLEGRRIARVRGNRNHVASLGYACEKAQRIDFYQNGRDRLASDIAVLDQMSRGRAYAGFVRGIQERLTLLSSQSCEPDQGDKAQSH